MNDWVFATAETFYPPSPDFPDISPAERPVVHYLIQDPVMGRLNRLNPPNRQRIAVQLEAKAEVNHGRWIVRCPLCDLGAQMASRSDRRYFCRHCLNAAVGGVWLRVVWPPNNKRVEELLRSRPDPRNMNWRPGDEFRVGAGWIGRGETDADLERENAENGVTV